MAGGRPLAGAAVLSQRARPTWCGRGGAGRRMGPRAALLPLPARRGGAGLGGTLLGAALLGGVLLAAVRAHPEPDRDGDGAEPCRACRGLADSFSRVRGEHGGDTAGTRGEWGPWRGGGHGAWGGDMGG